MGAHAVPATRRSGATPTTIMSTALPRRIARPGTRATPRRIARSFARSAAAAVVAGAAVGAAGCSEHPSATAPAAHTPIAAAISAAPADDRPWGDAEAVRRRLESAASGLLYTSESDYAFEYVRFPAAASVPLSEAEFRAAAGVPADSTVEERTLDDFFARHIERVDPDDPVAVALVPRYEALKRTIRTSVRDARVFRVGRIVIRCYLVGVDARGNVVGLATTAIET
jgi:hypothetical protein